MCERQVPELRNAVEMAAVFGLKVGTWRDLARRRHLPHYKVGVAVRWDLREVLAICREELAP